MIEFYVKRPIGVFVGFAMFVVLGVVAFFELPISLLPEMEIPEIQVSVSVPGKGSSYIEKNVLEPLRVQISRIHGLESFESQAIQGNGSIRLTFEYGTNLNLALLHAHEQVDLAMSQMSSRIDRPIVRKLSIGDIPAFQLQVMKSENAILTSTFAEFSGFVKSIIKRRLEQIPEIAMVDGSGFSEANVEISLNEDVLKSLGVSKSQILDFLENQRLHMDAIHVKEGHYEFLLHFSSEIYSLTAISDLPLMLNGRNFFLKDLASVRFIEDAQNRGLFYKNFERAINFAIIKQPAANVYKLQRSLDSLLSSFEIEYPDVKFEVTNNQRELLDFAIHNLLQDLLLGGVLAFLLMFCFIRQFLPALLIGITIPISLVLSMLGFYFLNISINIFSLGGLILGLGMIIDNSIVVIDSIAKMKLSQGLSHESAAVRATSQIVKPLVSSVLTNCAVYVPLVFLSGLAGVIFYDQALSITIGVFSSLFVSVIFLPVLYVQVYRYPLKRGWILKSFIPVTVWYEKAMTWTFRSSKILVPMVALFVLLGGCLFIELEKSRLPPLTRHDVEVFIDWNEPIHLEENLRKCKAFLSAVAPFIQNSYAWIGPQQYIFQQDMNLHPRTIKLNLQPTSNMTFEELQVQVEKVFRRDFPRASIDFQPSKNAFDAVFLQKLAALRLEVYYVGQDQIIDLNRMVTLVELLQGYLPHTSIRPIKLDHKIELNIRNSEARAHQISISSIQNVLDQHFRRQFVDFMQGPQGAIPIYVVNPSILTLHHVLSRIMVENTHGIGIPVSTLVDLEEMQGYYGIHVGKFGSFIPIEIQSKNPEKDLPIIFSVMDLYNDVRIGFTGSYFMDKLLVEEMIVVFMVSVLLLYFILTIQFESFVQPLFILAELPIALSGAFLFLFIGANSINMMSMIGIVVMGGLIINDSILKIDAINRFRREGMSLKRAIYEGGHQRLLPIIMITLTSVGTLLPTLFMQDLGSELQKPLALALMGGMLVGMIVSLFFVPLLYYWVYRSSKL